MNESRQKPSITVLGWFWLAIVVSLLFFLSMAAGEPRNNVQTTQAAVCRIVNQVGGANNLGSGTLIDKTADGREGLVLTCAHLFSEGTGEVVVSFADGSRHRARLIDVDRQADLAALSIATPRGTPVAITSELQRHAKYYACGYGPLGVYRCVAGLSRGQALSTGQVSLRIDGAVRSGDSGGGVFDEQGRLVAVIWGEAEGVTYASYGQPLRRFLSRVLGRRTQVVYSCPNGVCPQQPTQPRSPPRSPPTATDARWSELQRQIEELRTQKQDRGDYVTRAELPAWDAYVRDEDLQRFEQESANRHASLLDRIQGLGRSAAGKAVGPAAVSLLGLSGPMGWAVLAASSVGGWLIGRQWKRASGAGGRRRRRFRRENG